MNTAPLPSPWWRRIPGVCWAAVIAALYGLLTLGATGWGAGFPDVLDRASLARHTLACLVVLAAFLALVRWPVAAFLVVAVAVFQLRFMPGLLDFAPSSLLIPAGYHLGRRTRTRTAAALALLATIVGVAASAVQYGNQLTDIGVDQATLPEGMHYTASTVLTFITGHVQDVLLPVLAGIIVRRQVAQAEAIEARAARERAAVITAKAARKVNADDSATAGELIDDVVTETQAAQSSLRQMVRVLHDPDDVVPLHPQPRLGEIDALVQRARQINPDIVLEGDDPDGIPASDSTALAAVRIVQESLTNAHRHAPGAPVTVRLERDGDWLAVEVVNGRSSRLVDDTGLGMRQGIEGMTQRARLLGGSLEAGPHGRGWRVAAELPLHPVEVDL
ncbi:sensor histidine kinase [Luteococcus sp. Sow4_B9]|uniref:sensor histidine kinase n=1 Tax=Luteococcus sp. Sow4_B9 TaxID=3438792 RepID=UPI003F954421